MRVDAVFRALLLVVWSACSPSALALIFNNDLITRICIPEAVIDKTIRVPVGCKLIDCCPGCPGAGLLEWRISVGAKVLEGAELRFEGLSAAELKGLKIRGSAELKGDRIILRRGNSRIGGIPPQVAGKVTVGSFSRVVNQKAATQRLSVLAGSQTRPGAARSVIDDITLRQFLGPIPVNDFRWRNIITPCARSRTGSQPPQLDTLRIPNVAIGEPVVVMLDARTSPDSPGCANDMLFSSTGSNILGNLRARDTCNSEVIVFSAANRMLIDSPVNTWTNLPGDTHVTPPLEPVIDVPVAVWIADGTVAGRPEDEVNNANLLYKQNRVGVQFVASYKPLSSQLNSLINTDRCDAIDAIKTSTFYAPNTLNIYYVDGGFYGRNCAIKHTPSACSGTGDKGDGNITLIGGLINLVSVAHELGHAFGLRPGPRNLPCGGHTDYQTSDGVWVNLPGFNDDNIMRSEATDTASYLNLGQVFRMNTQKDEWDGTMLIHNGLRPATDYRECTPPSQPLTSTCPALAAEWP